MKFYFAFKWLFFCNLLESCYMLETKKVNKTGKVIKLHYNCF